MSFKNIFPNRLRMLRLNYGITQIGLAQEIGSTKQNINNWEKCVSTPAPDKLVALANYFDVPLDYLVGNGVFANWELVEPHLGEILQVLRNFFPEGLDPASLNQKQILFLFQALFAKIEVNGNVVKLYPLLPLEGLKDIQIPSDS